MPVEQRPMIPGGFRQDDVEIDIRRALCVLDRHVPQRVSRPLQRRAHLPEQARDLVIQFVEQIRNRHAEPERSDSLGGKAIEPRIAVEHGVEHERRVFDGARHWADMIERRAERDDAVG
jgi:hypothetical protein